MLALGCHDEGPAAAQCHVGALGAAGVQVQADEFGDVLGSGLTGDLRWGAFLHDAATFEDERAAGQHERFERIVRDQQARTGEVGQVALEFGLHVEAGTGVEG